MNKISFKVQDVEISEKLFSESDYVSALSEGVNGKIEGYPVTSTPKLISIHKELNGFIETLWLAFQHHKPVEISPDAIWLLICQGFAKHILINAEKLRHLFVDTTEKQTITIREDSFVKGQNNNWEQVFPKFSEQINRTIKGDLVSLLIAEFSTTTSKEKAAFELSLMNSMSKYFEYECITLCGIPEITLTGNPDDWRKILHRTEQLRNYELSWWVDSLMPILTKIVKTSEGDIDKDFWQSFYNYKGGSGGPYISGWVLNFFPYITAQLYDSTIKELTDEGIYEIVEKTIIDIAEDEDGNYNDVTLKNYILKNEAGQGTLKPDRIPKGITRTDFKWNAYGKVYDMEFVSGFLGIKQNSETFYLSPEISWLVKEKNR